MEKHKIRSCRQRRKKAQLSIMRNNAGGGGIEGVVVLGALAIASLVVAFTIKKGRKHCNKDTTNLEAIDSCRKEEDGGEGLRFVRQDSSSTLHLDLCCTDHGTSKIGITQIENCELIAIHSLISEKKMINCGEEDSNSMNGDGEIVISDTEQENIPVTDKIHVVKNETNDSLVKKTIQIEIEDEVVDADAKQSDEEKSALQSSLSSDSVSSIEEEKCSLKQSSFSSEEGEGEGEGEGEEEYSLMQSSFSTQEEKEGSSPMESSYSTEEETNMEEDSSEETGSSSAESNVEAIWPAEMMGVLSPEPKEMDISQRLEEKDTTATIGAYHNLAKTFNESGTEEVIVMNGQKEHLAAAKRQIWVWLGLLLLLLLASCLLQPHHLANSFACGFSME